MTFAIYLAGILLMIVGVVLGGHYLKVPGHWIAVLCFVIAGLGIAVGATRTRRPDPS